MAVAGSLCLQGATHWWHSVISPKSISPAIQEGVFSQYHHRLLSSILFWVFSIPSILPMTGISYSHSLWEEQSITFEIKNKTWQHGTPTYSPLEPSQIVRKLYWWFYEGGEKEAHSYLFLFPIMILTLFSENVALIAFYLFHFHMPPPQAIFLVFNRLPIEYVWQEGSGGLPTNLPWGHLNKLLTHKHLPSKCKTSLS